MYLGGQVCNWGFKEIDGLELGAEKVRESGRKSRRGWSADCGYIAQL